MSQICGLWSLLIEHVNFHWFTGYYALLGIVYRILCINHNMLILHAKSNMLGCDLHCNSIADEDAYAEDIWYLLRVKENDDTGLGFWKVKGEACKLFSNSAITGWRTTLEFFEGQVPHERKTDWLMQEYWITQKEHSEKRKAKVLNRICNPLLSLNNICILFSPPNLPVNCQFGWTFCRKPDHYAEYFWVVNKL